MNSIKRLYQIFGLILLMFFSACSKQKIFTENDINIIPKPAELTLTEGVFEFSNATKFVISNEGIKEVAKTLIKKFEKAAGFKIETVSTTPNKNFIQFKKDNTFEKEAYELVVSSDNITITAKEDAGFIYGLETLRQLLPTAIENSSETSANWVIPALTIKDKPRFQHRGLMLDISRHFFDKAYIKKTIDRLVMHKMNVLHLHLVDDQGWRIEIKKYPKLTEVGAFRVDQEHVAWNSRKTNSPDEKGTYGGFLTQEELKEIVAYAQAKNIEVIPEIEMPAHVSSAIAAYPELSCYGKSIAVPSGGLWPITDIYCAGKESTFEFLENVLDEVMTIFPSKYIHIGGDEATKTNWEKCPHCQKRIKEEDLEDVEELQSYFVKRIEKYINSKGKSLIGWDEILEGGLAPEATVMSWRGTKGGFEAAEQGHDVIMTPESHCYFNFYQGPQNEEPTAFNAYTPLSKVYQFDPVVEGMTETQANHVLGGQANLWSEYITTNEDSEYMIFPRLAALSETLWSTKTSRNWENFSKRLETQFERYDNLGINYAKSAFLVTSSSFANLDKKNILISLENEFPNANIRYVLGDLKLDANAKKYTDTIQIKETTILKASLFKEGKPIGKIFTDTIKFHKAFGKKLKFKTPFNENYKGDGPSNIVNVIRGSKNFHDGQWQAWLGDDMEVVIDLGEQETLQKVVVGTIENQGAGIYFPTSVVVLVSQDGVNYTEAGKTERAFSTNSDADLFDFEIGFKETTARYIKVIANNLKKAPNGGGTWLFVDEILVD
ncbi:glycoside hydrolase family 20 protein [Mariniflexile litorale]|uniref:beta-N-acetylhexosaminidase n=1 Tax=Mariniflexile litorale TaxID=3045158 RepID=A0AAU7EF11_9FLAO|nr:glycoside hydrolase family 20 protein [Mariniflexile sp. KMM 9835]MDQ8210898.1 glycoside hydrolase family 20 protein [Mariniflexile sp. KMM 9835]